MTELRHQKSMSPIGIARNCDEYEQLQISNSLELRNQVEAAIPRSFTGDEFNVNGWCLCCSTNVSFHVDLKSGGQRQGSHILPNWRERLVCPLCGMNNRQRLIATLVNQELSSRDTLKNPDIQ